MNNPRFEDSNVSSLRFPDKEKVKCKDCILRLKDKKAGDVKIDGATLGACFVYPIKPPSILWKEADCPYYTGENE